MTKNEFIKKLNVIHKEFNETVAVDFLIATTKLGPRLSKDIIRNLWNCSNPKSVGQNIYQLMEVSAEEDSAIQFSPKLKKNCNVYFTYLDPHTAAFALFKIKKYNSKTIENVTTT